MQKIDVVTASFIAEMVNQHTNKYIAGLLTDIENHLGGHNKEVSAVVKDTANASKRIMVSRITKMEIESKYGG